MRVFISAGLFFPSKIGGPAKTLYWLAKGLVSNDINVSVVTSDNYIEKGAVELNKWLNVDNIKVKYCTTRNKFSSSIIWNSIKEIRNCDVVILSSIFFIPSFFIALITLFTPKKVIWSSRGELFDTAINGSKLKIIYVKLLKILFSRKIIFHATSEVEKQWIEKYFGNKVKSFIIPNYMELPIRLKSNQNTDKYFLYVGRIAPIKALDNLLLGVSKSNLFMASNCKLILAGGVLKQFEEYYIKLQQILNDNKLLKDKVVFLGDVKDEKKFSLFADAYFSILVSHSENFGNVVIEALSQGTPVIASKGTPWQSLKENNAGFWINNNDNNIAECIDEVLNMSIDNYYQIRENAYNLAKEFDIYSNVDKWLEVLR